MYRKILCRAFLSCDPLHFKERRSQKQELKPPRTRRSTTRTGTGEINATDPFRLDTSRREIRELANPRFESSLPVFETERIDYGRRHRW